MDDQRPLNQFLDSQGLRLSALADAERESHRTLEELDSLVAGATTDDVAFVVFGSLARREVTSGSDIDWTLLIDGRVDPAHFDTALTLEARLADSQFQEPGREGTFGGLTFSHDLIHRIGGADDTNRNTTQRILLLLESLPVGRRDAYDRVLRSVLHRYITEDWGWAHGRGPANVPRFLQNDLARYWRTVAVDFAYKRRDRGGKGWALRTVKLRVSRKMTYAAGLLGCFSLDLENVLNGEPTDSAPAQEAISHLAEMFALTPLDILARTAMMRDELVSPALQLLRSYDSFLQVINDEDRREHLKKLKPAASDSDAIYRQCRDISHEFQDALDGIFLGEDRDVADLTRKYGIF